METKYLRLPEGDVAYDDSGTGPVVVCVPGMGDLRGQYRFLVPLLVAAGYRVVTMDVRGHGETGVAWEDYSVTGIGGDVVALVRSLNAGPAVIIGNSMAAGAAVWASAEAPETVKALVLIGPAVHGDPGLPLRLLLKLLFARPWGAAAWLRYYSTLYPTQKPSDWNEYTALLKQNLSQRGRLQALHRMMNAPKTASEERLGKGSVPALVLMGSEDRDFKVPEAEAQWVAERVKGSYQIIADTGHYPHVESPDVVAPIIVSFIASVLESEQNHGAAAR